MQELALNYIKWMTALHKDNEDTAVVKEQDEVQIRNICKTTYNYHPTLPKRSTSILHFRHVFHIIMDNVNNLCHLLAPLNSFSLTNISSIVCLFSFAMTNNNYLWHLSPHLHHWAVGGWWGISGDQLSAGIISELITGAITNKLFQNDNGLHLLIGVIIDSPGEF